MHTAQHIRSFWCSFFLAATAIVSLAASSAAGGPNATSYTDPAGDNGTAPDITSVLVSNDAANQITFRVNLAKLTTPAGVVVIAIDSDENPATGYQGVDLMFLGDLASNHFVLARWDGSGFLAMRMSTATASSDDTGLTFSINASEVRTGAGFNFFVRTMAGSRVSAGNHDDAPDSGDWNYQLGGAAVLTLTAQQSISTKARAGKPFIAFVTVVRSDGEQAEVTYGDISCAATVGGRSLGATAIPTYGPAAGCSWRLPKHSKGKTLRAAVTVTLDAASVTQTFTAKIK